MNLLIYKKIFIHPDSATLPVTLLGQRAALLIKNRLLRRQERVQSRAREICYGKNSNIIQFQYQFVSKIEGHITT